ncbi:single-stranded DNA-binding protein [Paenisporosarcina sp. FSL H8-0542]|uniref:single-stranded DNA-binding protein n=1 Tax=unclassified Paenisporosarcina TaxID=2642018 RepID=UPI00034E86C3|nr:single-stranded DNA-binding protein [Paenisporosarcina sp. HGH0030]EPD51617.1 single-stranded DNA-binding protein [Paenisporosarcina sp. HGH0030]
MNQIGMIGRMTKDPVFRQLSEGRVQASFVLAVQRTYKSAKADEADFVLCTVWGKLAEHTVKYCGKGSLVGISGHIHSRSYQKEDGNRVFVTEVIVEEVQFLQTKPKAGQSSEIPHMKKESQAKEDFIFSEEEHKELPVV